MINRLRRLALPGALPALTALTLTLATTAAQAHTGADSPNRATAQKAADTRHPDHDSVVYRQRLGAARADAASAALRPASWSVIRHWMQRTVEVQTPDVHFRVIGHRAVVADGHGGSVTAVVGVRHITADGHGQLIFFFHNQRFVGWDSRYESLNTDVRTAGPQRFDADYATTNQTTRSAARRLPRCASGIAGPARTFRRCASRRATTDATGRRSD
jgi:hypothetical protein